MQMKAMYSSNQHEAKRLYRLSLDKFKTVCELCISSPFQKDSH